MAKKHVVGYRYRRTLVYTYVSQPYRPAPLRRRAVCVVVTLGSKRDFQSAFHTKRENGNTPLPHRSTIRKHSGHTFLYRHNADCRGVH